MNYILKFFDQKNSNCMTVFTILVLLTIFQSVTISQEIEAQPQNLTQSVVAPQVTITCDRLPPQSGESIQMNSVFLPATSATQGPPTPLGMKTILVTKEIFECSSQTVPPQPVPPEPPYRLDMTIFTEVFGSLNSDEFFSRSTNFTVVVCERSAEGDVVSCTSPPIPQTENNLKGCTEENIALPIKLNTLSINDHLAKSVMAETNIYNCEISNAPQIDMVKEVSIFTSLLEPGTSIGYMATTCIMDNSAVNDTPQVESCNVTYGG